MDTFAVIGVGNMAKAILAGIAASSLSVRRVVVFDTNPEQYRSLPQIREGTPFSYVYAESISEAVSGADTVLLSVKPQNYAEVLREIAATEKADQKLYISIGAGITVAQVSEALRGAKVVRVLPNVPILIGKGVALVCRNEKLSPQDVELVCDIFNAAGSSVLIREEEMNRMIGVTSSSPAYVFRFIRAIYEGAIAQGLQDDGALLDTICDVVASSAEMLKQTKDTPDGLISKVASKGGTTERALAAMTDGDFDRIVADAMTACTKRADELGAVDGK